MAGIEFSVSSGVASLVLDNPPQNRLGTELLGGFTEAVQSIANNRDIRAVLVRAEGRGFCAGVELVRLRHAIEPGHGRPGPGSLVPRVAG